MVHILKIFLESGKLVSGVLTVWEDTYRCADKYRCDLDIYVMTVLSSSYIIIMDCAINEPGHWKNIVDGLNATEKRYLKEEMEVMVKLASNYTTNIGMLPSASKYVSIKFSDQCLHILNNKERLNGLKGSIKIKKDNHNSNINHIYKMFKGTLMLITYIWKWDGTTNYFHN